MTSSGTEASAGVYECTSCGGIAFGDDPGARCCGTAMSEIDPAAVDIPDVEVGRALQLVFGLSLTSLEIVHWLTERGEARTPEITAAHDYDRSTVTRHLNRLHRVGLVDRQPRTRDGGGRVYLYSVESNEEVQRRLRRGLAVWLVDVLERVDEWRPE